MSEPWNLTPAQRQQLREAHAGAKIARAERAPKTPTPPDFSDWAFNRLTAQKKHLESLLVASAGQADPVRESLRAEHKAVCAEIGRRELKAQREHRCPRCHIAKLNRCRDADGTLLEHPHPERVNLVKED